MRQTIMNAIRCRRVVVIHVKGGDRTVEPYTLGCDKQGEEMIHVWQRVGPSMSGESCGWKTFKLSDIQRVESLKEKFEPGHNYDPKHDRLSIIMTA